jgi:intracellular sulfur oxidation DsrE/DsrF family protein
MPKELHIDIPVRLTEVKSVYSIGGLAFEGDLPASIFHLQLIENDIADWRAKSEIIAVFHTNAGHVTLHDRAYNTDRNIATGNPYKDLVTGLMRRGVKVELCGATAKVHGWGNEDLMPGILVNTDAMSRTTQLVQEGYVKITE